MAAPLVSNDTSVLEALDFEPRCEIASHKGSESAAKWLIDSDHWNTNFYREHSANRLACDGCKKKLQAEDRRNQQSRNAKCMLCGITIRNTIKNITSI